MANTINDYFINLNKTDENGKSFKSMIQSNVCSIFMTPVTIQEVKNIVKELKNKKSSGHDQIPIKLIKSSIEYIAEPLVHIINLTLESGIFPNELKKGLVKPIHKKGPKYDINNHRPIALLSNFSKIFEKVISNRLISFFKKNNTLSKNQYGFQKGKNTTLAIFKILKQIWTDVNKKKTTIGLFIDLSRAFDCVSHKLLLSQLEHVGIRGTALKLIQTYLTDRLQATILDKYDKTMKTITRVQSSYETILQGVPQGSVLGPLLFLLYVNELPLIAGHLCVMFADDATIFISEEKLNDSDITVELYKTINIITDWLSCLNLRVNLEKTKIVQFVNYRQAPQCINININNVNIEQVPNTNFLGITIDSNLNWKTHIEKINNKISKSCYALSILANITSKEVTKNSYYGNVYPLLSYGLIFWGNSVNIQSTFILQKKCLRIMYNVKNMESLRNVFKCNAILTLTCMYILDISLFVRDHNDYFNKISNSKKNVRSQYQYDMRTVPASSYILKKSTYVHGIKIYNHLPVCIKSLEGAQFKRKLKEWLLCKCFYNLNEYFNARD